MLCILSILILPGLVCYLSFFVDVCLDTAAVRHLAAIEIVAMMLRRFLHTAERGVIAFQCYDPRRGQGVCKVLVPLCSVASCCVEIFGFVSSISSCALDSSLSYFVYHR